jgi:sulfur-carrier protein adenylyltransferase/sulfurtransferase
MALPENELRRIARQLNLPGFGMAQAQRLADARILVVGAGGLGCPAMQSLAAVGLGRILLYDDDVVDLTNIHRQILFGAHDVGRRKVDAAADRLRQIQPGIEIDAVHERLTPENIVSALAGVDMVLDGSDTFATKYLVADAAEITGTPLIWGTVLRYAGQVALWHSGPGVDGGVSLRDFFPTQPAADSTPDCATAGVLGVTTSVVGNLMATEAIKYLTGLGESVPGRVYGYDALGTSLRSFTVRADPARMPVTELEDFYGAGACATPPVMESDPAAARLLELVREGRARALDVREPHEKLLADLPSGADLHLPTSEASPERVRELLGDVLAPVVVYCASGRRSAEFIDAHAEGVAAELLNLPGGVNGL